MAADKPWGYCDPKLHEGRAVPAVWRVQGMIIMAPFPERPLLSVWEPDIGPRALWAACNRHLSHACSELLRVYSRVSVSEAR